MNWVWRINTHKSIGDFTLNFFRVTGHFFFASHMNLYIIKWCNLFCVFREIHPASWFKTLNMSILNESKIINFFFQNIKIHKMPNSIYNTKPSWLLSLKDRKERKRRKFNEFQIKLLNEKYQEKKEKKMMVSCQFQLENLFKKVKSCDIRKGVGAEKIELDSKFSSSTPATAQQHNHENIQRKKSFPLYNHVYIVVHYCHHIYTMLAYICIHTTATSRWKKCNFPH